MPEDDGKKKRYIILESMNYEKIRKMAYDLQDVDELDSMNNWDVFPNPKNAGKKIRIPMPEMDPLLIRTVNLETGLRLVEEHLHALGPEARVLLNCRTLGDVRFLFKNLQDHCCVDEAMFKKRNSWTAEFFTGGLVILNFTALTIYDDLRGYRFTMAVISDSIEDPTFFQQARRYLTPMMASDGIMLIILEERFSF